MLEGFHYMASHGIVPRQIHWRTVPGSKLAHVPHPRAEYTLRMETARHQVLKELDLLPKGGANRPPATLGHNFSDDWLDVPQEARWQSGLRS